MATLLSPRYLDELESLLREEVKGLRSLLANFVNEQQALLENKTECLTAIHHERGQLWAIYEDYADRFMEIAKSYMGEDTEWTHQQALEELDAVIEVDKFELRSLRVQLLALVEEINAQAKSACVPRVAPQLKEQPAARKVIVEVLDLPEA